jgi:imidazolonepropionase-like amidohydrolase
MKKFYYTLVIAAASLVFGSPGARAQTTTLRFGKLITGQGDVIADAVVVIEGNKISKVSSGEKSIPPNTTLIDLRPLCAIPGLIDVHTHITYYWDKTSGTNPWGSRLDPVTTVFLASWFDGITSRRPTSRLFRPVADVPGSSLKL